MHSHMLTEVLAKRFSPYAFNPQRAVDSQALRSCFEAARWSASSYNEQPWHFVYANRADDQAGYDSLLKCLVPFNQSWAKLAPVIGCISVRKQSKLFAGQVNGHAVYDCGAAMAMFTVQATTLGLSVHQMAGFEADKVKASILLPEGFDPLTMFVVGFAAENGEGLSEELQQREKAPRTRIPYEELVSPVISK